MHAKSPVDQLQSAGGELRADGPTWSPLALETKEIFRQLIADEVTSGRLTPARRRRIVRYAATLGMSAVEVGQVLETCRRQAAESGDPTRRCRVLPLADSPLARIPAAVRIWALLALVILADLLLLRWLW